MRRVVRFLTVLLVILFTTPTALGQQNFNNPLNLQGMNKKDREQTLRNYRCAKVETAGSKAGFLCAANFVKKVEEHENLDFKTVLSMKRNESAKMIVKALVHMHARQMVKNAVTNPSKKLPECIAKVDYKDTVSCFNSIMYLQDVFDLLENKLISLDTFSVEDVEKYKSKSIPRVSN